MSALSIFAPIRFGRLMVADAMNISRDPMLIFATLMSFAPSIALYCARPMLDEAALTSFGVQQLSRILTPFALTIPASLIGWVTGFLLLEDRDEGTLLAIDVTPIGKLGFLAYRVAVTAIVAGVVTAFGVLLLVPEVGWKILLLLVALIAAEAVASAVVLPAIARNKVEGLALTKLTSLAGIFAFLPLIPSPWRYSAGIVPTYWIGELLGLGAGYTISLAAIVALSIGSHIVAVWLLFRLFQERSG